MNEANQTAVARAPALAPVVLRTVPWWVTLAFPLLSPLAAVYWRERWNARPDQVAADVGALAETIGVSGKHALWEPGAGSATERAGLARAVATVLESQVSPGRPFRPPPFLEARYRPPPPLEAQS